MAVNGQPIGPERYDDDRARRLVNREFNLSYADRIPSHNAVDSGRWLDPAAAEVSAEQGIVETLGLHSGDRLGFDIAGEVTEVTLVGTRKLAWDSMKVNFFMIGSPAAFGDRPQSFITSFHLPPQRAGLVREWLARFPNLTVIDTTAIVGQIRRSSTGRARGAVPVRVRAAGRGGRASMRRLASSRDERMAEAASCGRSALRVASCSRSQMIELAASGLLAGLLAAGGSILVGWVLATPRVRVRLSTGVVAAVVGALAGAAVVGDRRVVGTCGGRRSPADGDVARSRPVGRPSYHQDRSGAVAAAGFVPARDGVRLAVDHHVGRSRGSLPVSD